VSCFLYIWCLCQGVQSTILDIVTPDDLRILVESIDEDSRRGNFQRIFPSITSQKYLQFFDAQRYYNLLLQTWVLRYNRLEAKGTAASVNITASYKSLH